MSFSRENIRRVREDFTERRARAAAEAEARKAALREEIPELAALDREIASAGVRVMQAAIAGGDVEAAVAEMKKRSGETEYYFAITLKESGKVIGEIEAFPGESGPQAGETGPKDTFSLSWMLNGDYVRKGYGYEAARAFFGYLFREKGARLSAGAFLKRLFSFLYKKSLDKLASANYNRNRLGKANRFFTDNGLAIANDRFKEDVMLPLCYAEPGETQIIKRIGGSPEVKQHLENLGFNVGGEVMIINTLGNNIIVKVKESRVAVSDELARRIMV